MRRSGCGELKGIRSRTAIWKPVTGLCSEALAYARAHGRLDDADRFGRASTHWLRHTCAKGLAHAVRDGPNAPAALESINHSDLRTCGQYVRRRTRETRAGEAAAPFTCDTVTVGVARLLEAAAH
ncbi:hypothetical protein [Paraburkholderia phytofirmans]|uniref:hypothetical protein n=1 Tax=Paraburkholderia phytofirmans TaxID=261302 RepID=UPI0011DF6F3D|nr:hypothetical protein [Paraburkholderia phytofirmans]